MIAIFTVVMALAVAYGLYTRRGSAINKHPHHRRYSDAPGAELPDEFSDFKTFEAQFVERHGPTGRRPRGVPSSGSARRHS